MAFDTLDPAAALWRSFGLAWLLVPEELRVEPEKRQVAQRLAERRPQSRASTPDKREKPAEVVRTEIEWPEAWQAQLAATPRGRIIWTYRDLGPDLLAARSGAGADPTRSRRGVVLRELAKNLGYPSGTHTFWPLLLDAEARPDLFWAGFKALGARCVFVFGQEAADLITGTPGCAPFSQWRGRGAIVWRLPEIDEVDDRASKRLLGYIRTSLQPLRIGKS